MFRPFIALALLMLVSCGKPAPSAWSLLEGDLVKHWQSAGIADEGSFRIEAGSITLDAGKPMTGVRFDGYQTLKLPVSDYEIEFEAQRLEGRDFFAALTFPVRRIDTCATLVVGGWGGALVGISSIDGQDASENATRSEQKFINGQWYHFRLQVRDDELKAWMNGNIIINASIKARTISLRAGDIEQCAPFGLATYFTKGVVRGLQVRELH